MERIIRNITDRLAEKLPAGREFYTPEDLQVLDIPEFITDRVIIEMNQNLSESLTPPDTEWASMDEQAVRFAWKNFLEAIKAEVRMPAVYARSLLETAVADTLELAVKPRVSIPDTLFGVDEELTVDLLKKRVRYITIGRKLAAALVRYMEKKERVSLSVKECREIITKVDERLMAGNNSLDWAKELDSLFLLAGPSVDTELLRIYFVDKGEVDLAERFDRHNGSVDRTEMIEIIAAPAATSIRQQKKTIKTEEKPDKKIASDIKSEAKEMKPAPGKKEEKKSGEPVKKQSEETSEDSILAAFQRKRSDDDDENEAPELSGKEETVNIPEESSPLMRNEADEDEEDDRPILSRFAGAEEEPEEEEVDESEPASIYKEMKLHQDEEEDKEEGRLELDTDLLRKWQSIGGVSKDEDEPVLSETDKPEDEDEVDSIELYNETTDDEEVPMWRAFLDREDLSKVKDDESDEVPTGSMMRSELDSDPDEEDDYPRPLSELFGSDDEDEMVNDDTSEAERLIDWMEAEESRFVKNIFSDNSKEYMAVLEEISRFESWKKASAFIATDIFEPRDVDVFDEVAVDFTDRLHTFFLEYKTK